MEALRFIPNNINEECGVFGVFCCENATELTYYGLHALQHRGQEGCGIATSDGQEMYRERGEGLVTEIFSGKKLTKLKGDCAIGHVRYSTAGGGGIDNVQPFLFRHHTGDFALAHNGNIVNSRGLKQMLESQGSIFQSSSDTEILAHLVKTDRRRDRLIAIKEALTMIEGAYAFLILTNRRLYLCRDKNGLRPLSIGTLNGGFVVSSETCAFEAVGATFLRDVKPGEMVVFERDVEEPQSHLFSMDIHHNMCAMEYVYFARPDSDIEEVNVHRFRKTCGRLLAQEAPVAADIVIGIPDSSISAAIGYAEESNIPYEMGLVKNKYVGRTFIQPSQELREKGVRLKLSPVRSLLVGKRVVLIDDSIVRGTTSTRIIRMLREAGATEIHVRIGCPQIQHPCFYGVDTSTYEELISTSHSVEEVRRLIDADTLYFLSEKALQKAGNRNELCMACYNGKYPTALYQTKRELNIEGKF
ncbi:MAG: amidophosphoribosyltransferase [Bacteroidales bacterium]|jgi:amidophosphoribosyltransferase|nr:amidophosphoribosyltransferase [Bacteroidales bacterium]